MELMVKLASRKLFIFAIVFFLSLDLAIQIKENVRSGR